MNDELDEFTAQLNNTTEEKPQAAAPTGAKPGAPQQQLTPQQMAQLKAAKEMQEKMAARPL
jgi:hypothetical protein